jgi:hypothetical protein
MPILPGFRYFRGEFLPFDRRSRPPSPTRPFAPRSSALKGSPSFLGTRQVNYKPEYARIQAPGVAGIFMGGCFPPPFLTASKPRSLEASPRSFSPPS